MTEDQLDASERTEKERLIGADVRAMTLEADELGRAFVAQNNMTTNDFRALLFVGMAETSGEYLTAGDLRRRMGLSGAAITYLVERMTETGHLRREVDPTDRRKVILRYADHGVHAAMAFFTGYVDHNRHALADIPDADLEAAHRTFTALTSAMQAFRAEVE